MRRTGWSWLRVCLPMTWHSCSSQGGYGIVVVEARQWFVVVVGVVVVFLSLPSSPCVSLSLQEPNRAAHMRGQHAWSSASAAHLQRQRAQVARGQGQKALLPPHPRHRRRRFAHIGFVGGPQRNEPAAYPAIGVAGASGPRAEVPAAAWPSPSMMALPSCTPSMRRRAT